MSRPLSHILCILMGPPGSGKGSLAQKCAIDYGWHQLSIGDLCRTHIAQKTEIGRQIDFLIKAGRLIEDKLVLDMVNNWLKTTSVDSPVIILDGFPRTGTQAEALDHLIHNEFNGLFQPIVVELHLSDIVATDRIINRLVCSNNACGAIYQAHQTTSCTHCNAGLIRRSDDTALEVIRNRMATYHQHAQQVLSWFQQKQYAVTQLDASLPAATVFENFYHLVHARLV